MLLGRKVACPMYHIRRRMQALCCPQRTFLCCDVYAGGAASDARHGTSAIVDLRDAALGSVPGQRTRHRRGRDRIWDGCDSLRATACPRVRIDRTPKLRVRAPARSLAGSRARYTRGWISGVSSLGMVRQRRGAIGRDGGLTSVNKPLRSISRYPLFTSARQCGRGAFRREASGR